VSAVLREWKLGLLAVVVMIVAQVFGLVAAKRETSGSRLRALLEKDGRTKP
jgi:hypothetical protein